MSEWVFAELKEDANIICVALLSHAHSDHGNAVLSFTHEHQREEEEETKGKASTFLLMFCKWCDLGTDLCTVAVVYHSFMPGAALPTLKLRKGLEVFEAPGWTRWTGTIDSSSPAFTFSVVLNSQCWCVFVLFVYCRRRVHDDI
jgi:hypothetical protein